MQMIDVIKRLAELDASNPNVAQPTLKQQPSLATVSNIEGDQLSECGPMGSPGMSRTPASIHMTADNGSELTGMLRDIMTLAGTSKGLDRDMDGDHDSRDHRLEPSQGLMGMTQGQDMAKTISMIDSLNDTEEVVADEEIGGALAGGALGAMVGGPLGALTGAAAGDSLTDPDADEVEKEGMGAGFDTATTTPDEKIKAHSYGDDQVKPKRPEPVAKAGGGNPYTESVDQVSLQLLKAYEAFKNGQ